MDDNTRQLVQAIHDSPYRLVLVTAGAGTQALSDLLGVAGASRTVLEAVVPYSEASFDEFLGRKPPQYVSLETAHFLAGRAFTRARWLEAEDHPTVGLACTATIITDRPKRGEHRAHIAVWQRRWLTSYNLYLQKGARDRYGEESVVSRVMLNAVARAIGLEQQLEMPLVAGDSLVVEVVDFAHRARELHEGRLDCFGIEADGRLLTAAEHPPILLSGSFNPLHEGHLGMAQAASDLLGQPAGFELSAVNVDKPPLSPETVLERLAQFAGRYTVFASNAPTFVEKARLYAGTTFVVGYDTAVRILHPRYYQNSETQMMAALAEIRRCNGRFLVVGRTDDDGKFRHLEDIAMPTAVRDLFLPLPRDRFRRDISSSELRAKGLRGSR
ncbi:MAG: hypothetical protein H6658_07095 [Ardenticatenaceae bacterium]|nr:hypothetical protein [Ardenticatenaceae bacterium]